MLNLPQPGLIYRNQPLILLMDRELMVDGGWSGYGS